MIKQLNFDRVKPIWCNVWHVYSDNKESDKCKTIYLYSISDNHFTVHPTMIREYLNGERFTPMHWNRIEFIKPKKQVQFSAKTCPRNPVLTHPEWEEGEELYPSIRPKGLEYGREFFPWEILMKQDFRINGKPAYIEVDE